AAPASPAPNEFPLAQSEGLAPTPAPKEAPKQPGGLSSQASAPLVHMGSPDTPAQTAEIPQPEATQQAAAQAQAKPAGKKKGPGFFSRIGHFFRRLFGAE